MFQKERFDNSRNIETTFAQLYRQMFLTSFKFFVVATFSIPVDAILDDGKCTSAEAQESSLFYLDLNEDMLSLAS